MSCQEIRERLEDLELGFLEPAKARACRAHVGACAACAHVLEEVRETLRVLEGLSAPAPHQKRAIAPVWARLAVAAGLAGAMFGSGWIASSLLRAQPSSEDSRIAPLRATVAEQAQQIAELRGEQLRSQHLAEALRGEIAGYVDAQARLETARAQRESEQRREIARLERQISGVSGELARCTASSEAAPIPSVASAAIPSGVTASPGSAASQGAAEPVRDVEPAAPPSAAPAERGPTLAPLGVWTATYRFVSGMVRKREPGVDDTVLAFREELMRISTHEE